MLDNLLLGAYAKRLSGATLRIIPVNDQGELVICVADEGAGMTKEEVSRLFGKFEQGAAGKRAGGSGLGLAIARKLVQLHGGRIWAESEVGKGSRFYFAIPAKPAGPR